MTDILIKKRRSSKRRSAKRRSIKKRSAKRRSAKRLSAKKGGSIKGEIIRDLLPKFKPESSKPESSKIKRSSVRKEVVKNLTGFDYKMSGMGVLLNMYGGASETLEHQVAMKLAEIAELKKRLAVEKNKERIIQIQKAISRMEDDIQVAKEKMKSLLKGAADTVSKAVIALGDKTSKNLSKLSSDLFSRTFRQKPIQNQQKEEVVPLSKPSALDEFLESQAPPSYSFKGGSKKYETRIEKRFVASSPSKISLSMTGESE